MVQSPYLIPLPQIPGKSGWLSFVEEGNDLPIEIKRAYWIYGSSASSKRGQHAHVNSDRVMVCMTGSVLITMENPVGDKFQFTLDHPAQALYFPRLHWIDITLSPGAILLVFASCILEEDEVVKVYPEFKQLQFPPIGMVKD